MSLLPPQYCYNWSISTSEKKTLDCSFKSQKYKDLQTDVKVLPDYTESNDERMVKLKVKLTLGKRNVNRQEDTYRAHINAILYDAEASSTLGQHNMSLKFAEDKDVLKFLMNLGKQELVERSRSKQLEIRVEIKVYGTKVCGTSNFSFSEEGNGFMMVKSGN